MENYRNDFSFNEAERASLIKVISSFKMYRNNCIARIDQRIAYMSTLSQKQQTFLEKYVRYLNITKDCVDANSRIIDKMCSNVGDLFINQNSYIEFRKIAEQVQDPNNDEVHNTFRAIVRDWTDLGIEEREQCYKPILEELAAQFGDVKKNQYRVLVPGAGPGRLVYEIALKGFYCEGNECSKFALITSNFIVNRCFMANLFELYPFCHQFMNNMKRDDPLTCCRFPDVSAHQNLPKGDMTMIAGEFMKMYSNPSHDSTWDCVCSCFFIDLGHNIIEFLEQIYRILRPGGFFINCGPLLYRYCDLPNELSIEPSYEDIREIMEKIGFEFIKEDTVSSISGRNASSVASLECNSLFFVARKNEVIEDDQN